MQIDHVVGFLTNSYAASVGLIATLLSLIFAVVPLLKRSRTSITYRVVVQNFTSRNTGLLEDIEIIYGGIKVNSISKATIYMWNSGSRVIKFEDVSKSKPLGIVFENGDYLSCRMLASNDSAEALKLIGVDSYVNMVSFEFLNPGEGAVFEAYYDETHSGSPILNGALAGGKIVRLSEEGFNKKPFTKYLLLNFYIYLVSAIIAIAPLLFIPTNSSRDFLVLSPFYAVFVSPVAIFIAWYSLHNQPPVNLAPKSLLRALRSSEERAPFNKEHVSKDQPKKPVL